MIDNALTLKEWATIAIAKHSRKIFKYEAKVIEDRDPEDLHQMRVGMRRLRSAIAAFSVALDLPPSVNEKKIAKVGRSLGKLRDLDVLLAALTNDYRPQLSQKERVSLDEVIKTIKARRKRKLKQVRETLDSKLYLNLRQGLEDWLEQPQYQTIGDFSIYPLLPDLLLPQLSQLLLHPGWLVGIELNEGIVRFFEMNNSETVKLLEQKEPVLHDLRKEAKRTRYNLELFANFYDDAYQEQIKQIEQVQEVLGQIQDCYVLKGTLEKVLEMAIAERIPQLAALLTETRSQKWQEWKVLQRQFLDDTTRKDLRQTVQRPTFKNSETSPTNLVNSECTDSP